MANSKGAGSSSNLNDAQILKDLVLKLIEEAIKKFIAKMELLLEDVISKMNQFEEDFKKFLEELDNTQRENESAMRIKKEVTLQVAELAKRMTKPDVREVVIKALQKKKDDSNNSSFTLIELMLGSFKDYLKDHSKAEIGSVENYEECTLDELLNKLSENAQQVTDLKDQQI